MKKTVFRIGDKIKVINPEFFIRCGYKLTKEDGLKLITEDEKKTLINLLGGNHIDNLVYKGYDRVYEEILDRIAYSRISKLGFGGPNRSIFTESKPEFLNKEFTVIGKKVVQTGVYQAGYTSGGWDGYESEAPYLSNVKSNVILKLMINDGYIHYDDYWIEEKNVVKIENFTL